MHRSPSEETFAQERRHSLIQQASGRMLRKTAREWSASGATIVHAWHEVAKRTPFLPSELGPQNAATEGELRNARQKKRPNVVPKNETRAARISEWEKAGVDSSSISSG
jgi:hypothetical protein